MRLIIASSTLLLCAATPGLAAAQGAPPGPAPAPVVLPEEPEEGSATGPSKGAAAPAPPAEAKEPVAPPADAARPAKPVAPPAAAAPPAAPAPARAGAPTAPNADSGVEEPRGPVHSRFNVAVNVDTVWYSGRSFDFFSDHDSATAPGVSLGYALWMDDPVSLVPELGWSTNSESQNNLYAGAFSQTELKVHNAYGGLSLRLGILSFLEAHARFAGGASFVDASFRTGRATTADFESKGVSPFGSVGGGITVHSAPRALETKSGSLRTLMGGITIEGGYLLGSELDFTPTPTGDPGRIPTTYLSFGKLERSGPYVRTSLVVRF